MDWGWGWASAMQPDAIIRLSNTNRWPTLTDWLSGTGMRHSLWAGAGQTPSQTQSSGFRKLVSAWLMAATRNISETAPCFVRYRTTG